MLIVGRCRSFLAHCRSLQVIPGCFLLVVGRCRSFLVLVSTAHISTVLLYASVCLAPTVNNLLKLECNNCAMIWWICNVCLKDHVSSDYLLGKLGINNIKHYYSIIDCVGLVMLHEMMAVLTA